VSVPTAELTASTVAAPRRAPAATLTKYVAGGRLYLLLGALALVIAAFTLLIPSTPSYDPWAWLVWGREIIHFNLQTTGGPTWKPLPVIFTTLFAPFGKAAPDMWLVVARAGALMAAMMVFKLCARLTLWLGGEPAEGTTRREQLRALLLPAVFAGIIGAGGLVLSGAFIKDNALGYSEGLMTALVLIGVERHLDGHRRQAFALGFVAALDRPEIWLFWGPYGLYLWWTDPGARKLVYVLFVLIPVLWFLPELWGSGHLLRGVNRAQNPRSNSPAFASCPFCTELNNAWVTVLSRIKAAAGIGVIGGALLLIRALRARSGWTVTQWTVTDKRERAMLAVVCTGLFGLAWWVVIAVLTQAGFSGNNRYLVLGAALIEISGGVTWGWAAIELRKLGRRAGGQAGRLFATPAGTWPTVAIAAIAFAFIPGFVGNSLTDLPSTHRALVYQAHLREDASNIVQQYGGTKKLLACGSVMTEGFQVPMVAWTVDVHTLTIEAPAPAGAPPPAVGPNVILQTRATRSAALLPIVHTFGIANYKLVARNRTFRLLTDCRK
jgi:hypothetical protein